MLCYDAWIQRVLMHFLPVIVQKLSEHVLIQMLVLVLLHQCEMWAPKYRVLLLGNFKLRGSGAKLNRTVVMYIRYSETIRFSNGTF